MEIFIGRTAHKLLEKAMSEDYIAVLLGPRQVGKTTLSKKILNSLSSSKLSNKEILSLNFDDPELRKEIKQNPKALIRKIEVAFGQPIDELTGLKYLFLDEVQKSPTVFDVLKILYDEHRGKIKIFITGSSSLNLLQKSSETLSGRVRLYRLSSLSWKEILFEFVTPSQESLIKNLANASLDKKIFLKIQSDISPRQEKIAYYWNKYLLSGGLPEIFLMDEQSDQSEAFNSYIKTYLENDIRSLPQVGDESFFLQTLNILFLFDTQIVNYSNLSNQIGIQRPTLKKYLQVLEQTFVVRLLKPFVKEPKQSSKSPKIYFFDHGLVTFSRKLFSLEQLKISESYGSVFENIIVTNTFRYFANNPQAPNINFWRDYQGHEIDLIISDADKIIPIEITTSKQLTRRKKNNFQAFYKAFPKADNGFIVWTGNYEEFTIDDKTITAIPYWMWF